jgi:hypothetical protein
LGFLLAIVIAGGAFAGMPRFINREKETMDHDLILTTGGGNMELVALLQLMALYNKVRLYLEFEDYTINTYFEVTRLLDEIVEAWIELDNRLLAGGVYN